MRVDKYDDLLETFKLYFPQYYDMAVDWWVTGPMSIGVKLNDGRVYEFDRMDQSIRRLRTDRSVERNEETLSKELGHNILKLIPLTGKTHQEIADELGVSRTIFSRYVRGKSMPSAGKLYKLARILGCTMDALFDGTFSE